MIERNYRAWLALQMFCHRVAKAVLALSASLSRVDAISFTGGLGENSSTVREKTINRLSVLGVDFDVEFNLINENRLMVASLKKVWRSLLGNTY